MAASRQDDKALPRLPAVRHAYRLFVIEVRIEDTKVVETGANPIVGGYNWIGSPSLPFSFFCPLHSFPLVAPRSHEQSSLVATRLSAELLSSSPNPRYPS